MKINKLAIQNFRNHRATAVELDKLNIFVGHNNSGKSSILAAIEWALTGRNAWTDKAGRGANDLVTRGEKACQVALDIEGLGGVVRSMPPHTLTAGKYQGVREGQAAICNSLGADEKLIQLVMNAGAFTGMSPAEQKAFLFSLCGVSFSAEKVASAVEEHVLKTGAAKELAREVAGRAGSLMPRGISGDPGILEGMEKKAREMRKEVKKDLERTRAALAEMVLPNLPDGIDLEDKGVVERQIAELESEKNRLLQAHGARRAAEKNITHLRSKVSALEDEIERLLGEKTKKTADMESVDEAGTTEELNRLKKQLEQLVNFMGEFNREKARLTGENEAGRRVVEKLRNFDGQCPLAPGIISCRMSSDEVSELINKLESEIKDGAEKIEELQSETKRLQMKKEEMLDKISLLEKTLAALAGTKKEITDIEAAIERNQKELAGSKKELAALENSSVEPGGIDPEEIDRLQERIARGREILRQLEIAEHERRQADQLQKDLQSLQEEVEVLEYLVKALGPDGIRKNLLGGRLAGFTDQLNSRLAACTEGRYRLAWQGDFTPVIEQNGYSLPMKLLSKSEQLRVGVAFQAAVAQLAGLRFLAVDEVDVLDQDNRDLLTGSLLDMLDEFDQIMVFCTVGDVRPSNPGLPGVKMFWVEDGTVKELANLERSVPA